MPNTLKKHPYNPDYAVPPGRTLEETMEHYGIGIEELAEHLGITTERVYGILCGDVPIDSEIAAQLESITRVPERIWNAMELTYR
jgi:plasmid maintenance system antidote protein VapI